MAGKEKQSNNQIDPLKAAARDAFLRIPEAEDRVKQTAFDISQTEEGKKRDSKGNYYAALDIETENYLNSKGVKTEDTKIQPEKKNGNKKAILAGVGGFVLGAGVLVGGILIDRHGLPAKQIDGRAKTPSTAADPGFKNPDGARLVPNERADSTNWKSEDGFKWVTLKRGQSVDVGPNDYFMGDGAINGTFVADSNSETADILDFQTGTRLTATYPGDLRRADVGENKGKLVWDAIAEKLGEGYKKVFLRTYGPDGKVTIEAFTTKADVDRARKQTFKAAPEIFRTPEGTQRDSRIFNNQPTETLRPQGTPIGINQFETRNMPAGTVVSIDGTVYGQQLFDNSERTGSEIIFAENADLYANYAGGGLTGLQNNMLNQIAEEKARESFQSRSELDSITIYTVQNGQISSRTVYRR